MMTKPKNVLNVTTNLCNNILPDKLCHHFQQRKTYSKKFYKLVTSVKNIVSMSSHSFDFYP